MWDGNLKHKSFESYSVKEKYMPVNIDLIHILRITIENISNILKDIFCNGEPDQMVPLANVYFRWMPILELRPSGLSPLLFMLCFS